MRRICVYCGSSPGSRPDYADAARALGQLLGERGLGLVYGGARVGTMGTIADAALQAGGEVFGVITHRLVEMEVEHTGLTELHVVETMHERKARMESLADGFVVLPGAYGTLDELFEILAWMHLGIHSKPVGILNLRGFYDGLLGHMDLMVREGFLPQGSRDYPLVDDDAERLLDRLGSWGTPSAPQR